MTFEDLSTVFHKAFVVLLHSVMEHISEATHSVPTESDSFAIMMRSLVATTFNNVSLAVEEAYCSSINCLELLVEIMVGNPSPIVAVFLTTTFNNVSLAFNVGCYSFFNSLQLLVETMIGNPAPIVAVVLTGSLWLLLTDAMSEALITACYTLMESTHESFEEIGLIPSSRMVFLHGDGHCGKVDSGSDDGSGYAGDTSEGFFNDKSEDIDDADKGVDKECLVNLIKTTDPTVLANLDLKDSLDSKPKLAAIVVLPPADRGLTGSLAVTDATDLSSLKFVCEECQVGWDIHHSYRNHFQSKHDREPPLAVPIESEKAVKFRTGKRGKKHGRVTAFEQS